MEGSPSRSRCPAYGWLPVPEVITAAAGAGVCPRAVRHLPAQASQSCAVREAAPDSQERAHLTCRVVTCFPVGVQLLWDVPWGGCRLDLPPRLCTFLWGDCLSLPQPPQVPPSPAPQDPPARSFGALLQAAFRSEGEAVLLDEAVQARLRDAVPHLPMDRVLLSVKHVLLCLRTTVERFRQVSAFSTRATRGLCPRPPPWDRHPGGRHRVLQASLASPASPSLHTSHVLLGLVAGQLLAGRGPPPRWHRGTASSLLGALSGGAQQ